MAHFNPPSFRKLLHSYGKELARHVLPISELDDWMDTLEWLSDTHTATKYAYADEIREYKLWLERAAQRVPSFAFACFTPAQRKASRIPQVCHTASRSGELS